MSTAFKTPEADPVAAAALAAHVLTDASDAELAAAVATVNTALSGKQDASTAATDAELASAVATINAAVTLKQDASSAATDSELASALATHEADTTSVHGITDTSALATTAGVTSAVAAEASRATAAEALAIPLTQRGATSGVATLDATSLVPLTQLAGLKPICQRFARDLKWANEMPAPVLTTTAHGTSSGAYLMNHRIVVVGDSTGVDGDATNLRWPHLLANALAALYPNIQFRFYQWSDTDQATGVATVINTPSTINATCDVFNLSISGTTEDYWLRQGSTTASLTSGATTNGSRTVTVASTVGAMPNNGISGTGIQGGSIIVSVDSATTLTMSNDATATNTGLTLTVVVPKRLDVIVSQNPDVLFISHGHNVAANFAYPNDPIRYRERIQALTESITARCPQTKVVLVAQNEEVSPAVNGSPNIQGVHARALRQLAHICGYDMADIYDVFHNAAGGASAWLTADGVHPTYDLTASPSAVGTPTTGSALWRDAIYKAMTYMPGWPEKSQQPSGLTVLAGATGQSVGSKQLLLNGNFVEYTTSGGSGSGVPAGWNLGDASGSITFAKDTTNVLKPFDSSLKCTATASTTHQCYLEQKVAGSTAPWPAARLAGQWVTLAVLMRCASGQRVGKACKLGIQDGVSDNTQSETYDLAWDTGTSGGFFLALATRFIPYHATRLWVDIYIDSGTDNAQANIVSIQWASLVLGQRPMGIV